MIAVRQAYLYDIRSGSYLYKLTGHTDTVLAVAFHPKFPQVQLLIGKHLLKCTHTYVEQHVLHRV